MSLGTGVEASKAHARPSLAPVSLSLSLSLCLLFWELLQLIAFKIPAHVAQVSWLQDLVPFPNASRGLRIVIPK